MIPKPEISSEWILTCLISDMAYDFTSVQYLCQSDSHKRNYNVTMKQTAAGIQENFAV